MRNLLSPLEGTRTMQTLGRLLCVACSFCVMTLQAQPASSGVSPSLTGQGLITTTKAHLYADVLLDRDRFDASYTLDVAADDIGQAAALYVLARVNGVWFMHDGSGYLPLPGSSLAAIKPYASRVLQAQERLPLLSENRLYAGDYALYAGYRIAGGELKYAAQPLTFSVQSDTSDHLLRFRSATDMESFLRDSVRKGLRESLRPPLVQTAVDSSAASSNVSSTNLQTAGVDEGDSIKVDGNLLYQLGSCAEVACLKIHTLDPATATHQLSGSIEFSNGVRPESMYLAQDEAGTAQVVTIAGQNQLWSWRSIWDWSAGSTTLEFFDAADPQSMRSREVLTLDGALVQSRRVGDILYLVTRYAARPLNYDIYPVEGEQDEGVEKALAETSFDELLPKLTDAQKNITALVDAENCYLPASAVDDNSNASIITISSISLSTAEVVSSTCFLGGSEALYMTPQSLYLATTAWGYSVQTLDSLIYSPEHTTTVHKFSLLGAGIEYRGSAEVKGHLGWSDDKKSFRMGENGEFLNIVTSIGDTWDGSSSTSLTVLQETPAANDAGTQLQVVSVLDGLGKPGEELYAARFVGDRAFLVTFRVTDPLYVIDLSNQTSPTVVAELEINGYSDYLHPLTQNLLLGVGKDAVAVAEGGDNSTRAGAWYQGVKLALFDISNPAAPRIIDTEILGKRGTETDVLWDHHAFTFLPATTDRAARIALPVQLHTTPAPWIKAPEDDPSAWYELTHSGLYSFDVDELGIHPAGTIIAEEGESRQYFDILPMPVDRGFAPFNPQYPDRSVLNEDAVYYLHADQLFTSFWGEDKDYSQKSE